MKPIKCWIWICERCKKDCKAYAKKNRQTLFFSATMPIAIRELAEMFLTKPETVTVSPVSSTAENEQRVYFVEKLKKRPALYNLITNENLSDVLVFSRTKHGADNVVKALRKRNIPAEAIHGDKSQNARQRVLDSFKIKR
jgi:ATP-dependent RNA helicase RhlE